MRGAIANGAEILDRRLHLGWTQEQLATRAKVDVKTIRKAEKDKRLDLVTLTQIGVALDADLSLIVRTGQSARQREIQRRDVVMKWNRAFDCHDMTALQECYRDDATLHLPGDSRILLSGKFRGKTEIRRAYETAWSAKPSNRTRDTDFTLIVGDTTVVLLGRKLIHPPVRKSTILKSVQIFAFHEELILNHEVYCDTLTLERLQEDPPHGNPGGSR